ncbi:MAG: BON domain-containing protein [Bdellovibrionota bacterium]
MSNLKVSVSNGRAALSGFIDETTDLSALASLAGEIILNLKEVSRVNSCGVREWVNWLCKAAASAIVYEECPVVVVKQLNAVPDFQGKAKISSFFAPYFCEDCDSEAEMLLQSMQVEGGKAPEMKCGSCGKPMNFDAVPNQYFSFIKR